MSGLLFVYILLEQNLLFQMLFAFNKRNLFMLLAAKIQLCRKFQQKNLLKILFKLVKLIICITVYYNFFFLAKVTCYWFIMLLTKYETVTFHCTIWDFHVYQNTWQPIKNQMLQCYHESNNDYDSFSKKKRVKKQISRNFTTKFLLGTTVTATRSSTHYKRYSLVQEGV